MAATTYPISASPTYYYSQPTGGSGPFSPSGTLNPGVTIYNQNADGTYSAVVNPTAAMFNNPNNPMVGVPLPSNASFPSPSSSSGSGTGSGIVSSASLQNYNDQIQALLNAIPGLNNAQQSSIQQTGAAAIQQINAQGQAGDAQFAQAIEQAQASEDAALGNSDVSAAQANPTGTENMQPFSPMSPGGQAQGLAANSTYAGLKANIANQFSQTIGNLQAQQAAYDAQVAANDSTAAAQTQANAITAANTAINNQLSIMNNMMNVALSSGSLQLQQETQSQNFQLGMANYQLQLQNNQQNLATGQMNTILSSLAGTGAEGGWNALSPMQQNQITTLANQAGLPASLVQAMINKTQVTNLTTATDPFGNTTLVGTDASGKVITSQYIGGGITPGSSMANAIAQSYGTTYSDIGANFFTTNSAKYSPYLIAAGYKNLPATQATAFQGQYSAYTNLNQVLTTLQSMSQLATSPGELVSDYPGRTLNELLQVDPNSTQNPSQFQADLATINSLNPSLYKAITSIQGLSGGIGLSALLNKSGNLLLDPNNTLQTNMQNVENLQGQLENAMQATYGGGLTFPSSSSPAANGNSFSSFMNAGGSASGSTDPLNLGLGQ